MAGPTTRTPDGIGIKETCPVLDNPEPDCYFQNLTSLSSLKAAQYCLSDFKQCPIYKRQMGLPEYGAQPSTMAGPTTRTPDGIGIKETCPVLDNPEPDCYCLNLTSQTIPMAVHYCLSDFRQCPIYMRYMRLREP